MSKAKKQNKPYLEEELELTQDPAYYEMLNYMFKRNGWDDPSNDNLFADK